MSNNFNSSDTRHRDASDKPPSSIPEYVESPIEILQAAVAKYARVNSKELPGGALTIATSLGTFFAEGIASKTDNPSQVTKNCLDGLIGRELGLDILIESSSILQPLREEITKQRNGMIEILHALQNVDNANTWADKQLQKLGEEVAEDPEN